MEKDRCEITFEPKYQPPATHPFWAWIKPYVITEIENGVLVEFDQDPGIGIMVHDHFCLWGYNLKYIWAQKAS